MPGRIYWPFTAHTEYLVGHNGEEQVDVYAALNRVERLRGEDLGAAAREARELIAAIPESQPRERILARLLLAQCVLAQGHQAEADELLAETRKQAEELKDPALDATVLRMVALADHAASRFPLMLRRGVRSRARAAAAGDALREAQALEVIAVAYDMLGAYEEALQHALEALQAYRRVDRPAPLSLLANLAAIYERQAQPGEAIAVADRCLDRCRAEGQRQLEAAALGTRGLARVAAGQVKDALADFLEARAIFAKIGDPMGTLTQEINLGGAYVRIGRFAEAEAAFARGQELLAGLEDDERLAAELATGRGRLELAQGRLDPAIATLQGVLARFETLEMRLEQADIHQALYQAFKQQSNWQEALLHHERFFELRQALLSDRSQARIDALKVRFEVDQLEQERHLSQLRNLELAEAYEQLAALNGALREAAIRDGLTGLYNRRHLETRLREEFSRAKRYDHPLAVLMCDIDHFKQVNDRFAHAAGDAVLRRIAAILAENTREADIVARYGGEEFVVVFTDTERNGAILAAEKIRRLVAAVDWGAVAPGLRVTLSGGVAFLRGHPDHEALLAEADRHLYAAKQGGRDQIIWVEDPDSP